MTSKSNKPPRQQALEKFFNDEVERLNDKVYLWWGERFEVLTNKEVKRGHKWSAFVPLDDKYQFREASPLVISKYYPELVIDK